MGLQKYTGRTRLKVILLQEKSFQIPQDEKVTSMWWWYNSQLWDVVWGREESFDPRHIRIRFSTLAFSTGRLRKSPRLSWIPYGKKGVVIPTPQCHWEGEFRWLKPQFSSSHVLSPQQLPWPLPGSFQRKPIWMNPSCQAWLLFLLGGHRQPVKQAQTPSNHSFSFHIDSQLNDSSPAYVTYA